MQKLTYTIPEFLAATGLKSRSYVYAEIAAGRLKTVKAGRRRLVPHEAAEDWLRLLEREAA